MHVHPQTYCPAALPDYQKLVGLSIARGFTNKVKELFGGPRACTHIGALINAMAPVAIQSMWGFSAMQRENSGRGSEPLTEEERRAGMLRNLNTCHVWAADGPAMTLLSTGDAVPAPLWAERRLAERGVKFEEWAKFRE